eukprot:COSAG01_NODE_10147_length_2236_cov_5.335049_3_plen_50_part_01
MDDWPLHIPFLSQQHARPLIITTPGYDTYLSRCHSPLSVDIVFQDGFQLL